MPDDLDNETRNSGYVRVLTHPCRSRARQLHLHRTMDERPTRSISALGASLFEPASNQLWFELADTVLRYSQNQ
jgi:hypothetical protein